MQISGSTRWCRMAPGATDASIRGCEGGTVLVEPNVLEIERLSVDADHRRRDPVRVTTTVDDASHQRRDIGAILVGRQPVALARPPRRLVDDASVGRYVKPGERAD